MARRSSARLRNRKASTPTRVSLSHDASALAPQTVPAKLPSLQENDDMPGAFPTSVSPPSVPKLKPTESCPMPPTSLQTPSKATALTASKEEMHPDHHQHTTAKPLDEARHLGFLNMPPHTEPPKYSTKVAALQQTPTKSRDPTSDTRSPSFRFTFRREHSLELSPEAKRLMHEKREEVARIREQMRADGEGLQTGEGANQRKMAVPKSKMGRFTQAHVAEFAKMDSIAGHASAFRADANHPAKLVVTTPSRDKSSQARVALEASVKKSLKRSPSKAGLDEIDQTPTRSTCKSTKIPTSTTRTVQLPAASPSVTRKNPAGEDTNPAAKRIKRAESEDSSTARQSTTNDGKVNSKKSQPNQHVVTSFSTSDLSRLASPTKSSLARSSSVKSMKTSRIPAPATAPSKPQVRFTATQQTKTEQARQAAPPASTPVKQSSVRVITVPTEQAQQHTSTPLLSRSPAKASLFPKTNVEQMSVEKPSAMMSALLARSPAKAGLKEKTETANKDEDAPASRLLPLLAQSPVKRSPSKANDTDGTKEHTSPTPYLARTPSKFNLMDRLENAQTPGKGGSSKLSSRFELLRKSPIKSILRTPQRLYSDDPAKIAAGTHLASPPTMAGTYPNGSATPAIPPSATKRVEFTSSTKAREREHQKEVSNSPPKSPTPPPNVKAASIEPETITYPTLPATALSPSPQKRRQTAGPGDFTFRAGSSIVFGPSPNAPATTTPNSGPSTIRHVFSELPRPAAPATGSKKRKFEFENHAVAAGSDDDGSASDKENNPKVTSDAADDEQRPTKRAKRSTPAPSPVKDSGTPESSPTKTATRRTTLGVKPKKGTAEANKRSNMISQARLNALSQPKRRG